MRIPTETNRFPRGCGRRVTVESPDPSAVVVTLGNHEPTDGGAELRCSGTNPAFAQPAIDHFRKVIAAAPLRGVTTVTGFVGRDWTHTLDDKWRRFLEVWKPLVGCAEDHGSGWGSNTAPALHPRRVARRQEPLHNPRYLATRLRRHRLGRVRPERRPSHLVLQGMDPIRPLEEFKDKLLHAHAKDVQIDRG